MFAAITPLPFANEIVWLSGVLELLFALFIWLPKYRQLTGLWLCLFCLAVLPSNINMAINQIQISAEPVALLMLWLRIPLQFVLIAWILYATDAFGRLRRGGIRSFFTLT